MPAMSLYASLILLTELLMLAMTIHVITYPGFTRVQKNWYLCTFIAIMLCAGGEFCAKFFDMHGSAFVLPLTIITVIQFSLAPMLPVFFAGVLGMYRPAIVAGTVFCLNVVFEVLAAPYGLTFAFDTAGKYARGPYYIVYEGSYIASILFLVVCLFYVGRRFRKRDVFTIVMVLVILAAALASMSIYKAYTDYIGIGICACLCYIYYNDLVQIDTKAELLSEKTRVSEMQERMVNGLANLIESRDAETGEHVSRTSAYVRALARSAREDGVYAEALDDRTIDLLYQLSPMHDIGKIVVSDAILKKPGRLTPEEFEEMKRHASEGGGVVRRVLSGVTQEEALSLAADIATYHHERWDGKGYPLGLAGEDIPLAARIMAIADVFDALISERCYKPAMPPEQAFAVIGLEAGTHFDPLLVRVFLAHREEFLPTSPGEAAPPARDRTAQLTRCAGKSGGVQWITC